MIDFTLTRSRSSQYRHVARHFVECASPGAAILAYGAVEIHEAYTARLKAEHPRKTGF